MSPIITTNMATYSQIAMQVGTKKVASVHRMSPIIDNVTKKGKSEYGIKLCSITKIANKRVRQIF